MKRSTAAFLFIVAAWPTSASAQQQQAGPTLSPQQQHGRQLLAQSCGVCHLPPALNAKTYGPPLNKAAANGDDDIMREYILNGTPRMPAFKYYLKETEITDIIAYVRTVPVPGAAPARPAGGGGE
jgi:mono/diheme cytochrome c family protein